MSLRPQICGFDLAKFRSLFGSGDATLINSIEAKFDQFAASNPTSISEDYCKTFRAALRQAVNQGIPFPNLAAEEAPHVQLAMMLAASNQELLGLDSDYWSHMAFCEAYETGDLFLPDEQDLVADGDFFRDMGFGEFGDSTEAVVSEPRETGVAHILYGRPLFGEQFSTSWSYYGYLSVAELRYLRSRLRPLDQEDGEIGGELAVRLASDLTRWCDELLAANKDLWCFWS